MRFQVFRFAAPAVFWALASCRTSPPPSSPTAASPAAVWQLEPYGAPDESFACQVPSGWALEQQEVIPRATRVFWAREPGKEEASGAATSPGDSGSQDMSRSTGASTVPELREGAVPGAANGRSGATGASGAPAERAGTQEAPERIEVHFYPSGGLFYRNAEDFISAKRVPSDKLHYRAGALERLSLLAYAAKAWDGSYQDGAASRQERWIVLEGLQGFWALRYDAAQDAYAASLPAFLRFLESFRPRK
ncbi:MAG: hypothetical protein HY611_00580 [Elusimicrobia bacterium]|nr:hypothetical protein [Elusimicrobiota bacterium]